MKKCCITFMLGCIAGIAVGYIYEEEMYDKMHTINRAQRKVMRRMRNLP